MRARRAGARTIPRCSSTMAGRSRRSASASRRSSASWSPRCRRVAWSSCAAAPAICSPAARAPARGACAGARRLAGHAGEDQRRPAPRMASRLELRAFDLAARDWRALRAGARCDLLLARGASPRWRRQAAAVQGPARGAASGRHLRARRPDQAGRAMPAGGSPPRTGTAPSPSARVQIYGDDRAQRRFAELRWNYFRWPDDNTIDHPSTVAEHVAWLDEAGFEAVELHWLLAGHAHLLRAQGLIAGGAGKGQIETIVTYLEMTAPPAGAPLPPPRAGIEVRRAVRPTVGFYRYLYDTIGADWTWYERKLLDDVELATIIQDPAVEVNVLWVGRRAGRPRRAGFSRAARRRARLFRRAARFHRPGARPLPARLGGPPRLARRGRGAFGCTPAISTIRARSASTRRPAFGSTTGARPWPRRQANLRLTAGIRPYSRRGT